MSSSVNFDGSISPPSISPLTSGTVLIGGPLELSRCSQHAFVVIEEIERWTGAVEFSHHHVVVANPLVVDQPSCDPVLGEVEDVSRTGDKCSFCFASHLTYSCLA